MITEVISKQASSVRWKEGGREEEGRRRGGRREGEVSGKEGGGGKEGERETEEGRGRGMLPYTNQLASTLVMYKFCMSIETDCAQSEV